MGFRVLDYSSVNHPQAGLSVVRPVRPGGRPERDGVSRAEGSEDYRLLGWRDEDRYPTWPTMDRRQSGCVAV